MLISVEDMDFHAWLLSFSWADGVLVKSEFRVSFSG